MTWGSSFINNLDSATIFARYKLSFLNIQNSVGDSFDLYDDIGDIQIARGSIRISGTRVIPQRWSVSFGGLSLQLTGDIRHILPKVRKGQLAILSCSINNSPWEILFLGSLASLSGQRGLFSLTFKDLLSTLQNSLDANAGNALESFDVRARFTIFYNAGLTTTTTGAQAFGLTDTDLLVNDSTIFKKRGTKGIVRVQNSGVDFYLFWTGSTSNSLTGCTTAEYGNTTRTSAPIGSTVTYCAWLEGTPIEIIGAILTSTGAGTNGAYDVYPQEWSIGGRIDKFIFDSSDAERGSKQIVASDGSTYQLGIAIEEPLTGGFRALSDILLTVGIFPVYRQNAISLRACTDPEGIETRITSDVRAQISDLDIIDVLQHDFFNPDISNTTRTSAILYNFSHTAFSGGIYGTGSYGMGKYVDSLPAVPTIKRDFSQYYLASAGKRQEQAFQDVRRLSLWDLYVSERITLKLPLRYAVLVAGDVVTLVSEYIEHLYDPISPEYQGRYCMVLGVDYSIDAQECIVTLGIPSPKMQRTTNEEGTDEGGYTGWTPDDTYTNTNLIIWLDNETDLNVSGGSVTSWTDRQNNFVFTDQAGNNNTLAGNPPTSDGTKVSFDHTNHEYLATDFDSKMDLSSTDGLCFAVVIASNADPLGDLDYNGATYYKAPIANCGRAYQLHFLDSFSGSTYINEFGFDNNSSQVDIANLISPGSAQFKIIIYNTAAIGGYSGEEGIYVDGTQETTVNYDPTNVDMSISPNFRIGRDPDLSYGDQNTQYNYAFGSFEIKEMLVFSIPLHDSDREKVEGYLAHKHGLTGSLPSSHPYKSSAPT